MEYADCHHAVLAYLTINKWPYLSGSLMIAGYMLSQVLAWPELWSTSTGIFSEANTRILT